MSDQDNLHRFLFPEHACRGELVRLEHAWEEVLKRSNYPLDVRNLLGEALAATALLAASSADPATGVGPPSAVIEASGVTTETIEGDTVHYGNAGATLTLSGSNSVNRQTGVPQTGGLSYQWRQLAGPTSVLSGETSASLTVTTRGQAPGAYQFELIVTDGPAAFVPLRERSRPSM